MNSFPSTPVIWKRSTKAKRITLRIEPVDGNIVLTLPPRATQAQAMAFLQEHGEWVAKALASLPPKTLLKAGHSIPIEGQLVPIIHEPEAKRGCWLDDEGLHVSGAAEHTERRVRDFLHKLASKRLNNSVRHYSGAMQLFPKRVDLRDVRSRWGSCTREGRIMLSWRLVFTPPHIRDYVVIHELAHLEHFNHSPAFWTLVERFCTKGASGRLAAERWLRNNGTALLRIA